VKNQTVCSSFLGFSSAQISTVLCCLYSVVSGGEQVSRHCIFISLSRLYIMKSTNYEVHLNNFSCDLGPDVTFRSGLSKQSCPVTRHAGAWGEWRYSSYSFLTSALDGSEWSASRPGRALSRLKDPRYPLYRRLGQILFPLRGSNPGRPVRRHYTD
jgi:hypothetical protein